MRREEKWRVFFVFGGGDGGGQPMTNSFSRSSAKSMKVLKNTNNEVY